VSLEWNSRDGWTGDPVPVALRTVLTCPQCQRLVTHLQVMIYQPERVLFVLCVPDLPRVTGWTVIPCLHEVSAADHDLVSRDGRLGFEPKENAHALPR
jgi:hypothetical protein